MRKDRFTEEALRNAQALAALKYSDDYEDQLAYAEAYDFARCQRPDGSFYGTGGQCRKGKETGEVSRRDIQKRKEELQKLASRGDRKAMQELIKMRSEGKIGKEAGFEPGAKKDIPDMAKIMGVKETPRQKFNREELESPKNKADMDHAGLMKLMAKSPTAQRQLKEALKKRKAMEQLKSEGG